MCLAAYQSGAVNPQKVSSDSCMSAACRPKRDLNDLLEAFRQIREKRNDVRLDLVGAGPLRDELIRRVSELNLTDSVSFLGANGHGRDWRTFHA